MKGKRRVEGASLVDGGRRVGSVLVVCALLMLVGFLPAFAPETLALEASTQEASARDEVSGRPADAVPMLGRVRDLEPDDLVAVYQLARAHAESGDDLVAAEEGFKAYIAAEDRPQEPEVASAHWRLALVCERQGRYEEAMAELDEAIRLNPEHVMAAESKERLGAEHP